MEYWIWSRQSHNARNPLWFGVESAGRQQWGPVSQTCTGCGRQGTCDWLPPHKVKILSGERWPDVLDTDLPDGSRAVSERFREAWRQSGLKGLSFSDAPLEVLRNRSQSELSIPSLYSAELQSSGTRIHVGNSGAILSRDSVCQVCRSQGVLLHADRIQIDLATWDGLAVFRPAFSPCDLIIATSEFVEWAESCGFSNLILTRASDSSYHRPEFEWKLMGYEGPMPSE